MIIKTNTPPYQNAEPQISLDNNNRPRISSRRLFSGHNEIVIEHQDDEYRLRITSNGKLILTK